MKQAKELQEKVNKMTTEEYINFCVENENMNLNDMYNNCYGLEGVYTEGIYSKEELIDIMYDHAKNGDTFFAMARDLDDNSGCDYFWFDWSCWGQGCTPIETKKELAQALLEGSL